MPWMSRGFFEAEEPDESAEMVNALEGAEDMGSWSEPPKVDGM